MIYYISMLSTTGGKLKVSQKRFCKTIIKSKESILKNLVIGFGITNKTISSLKSANGLVIGSMLCKTITNSLRMRQNPVTKLDKVVYNLKIKFYELDNKIYKAEDKITFEKKSSKNEENLGLHVVVKIYLYRGS